MPTIRPFDINPATGPIDRFTLYWYCAICNQAYSPSGETLDQLYALAGATSVTRYEIPGAVIPYLDYAVFPGDRALISIVGTRQWEEFALQAVGANLIAAEPWPGTVGFYWSSLAITLFDLIETELIESEIQTVALAGHSQGGAIAQLLIELINSLPDTDTQCIVTMGSPRSGNPEFAASLQNTPYARMTNQGDVVPMLPPSISTPLDRFLWLLPPPPNTSFQHGGTRINLFDNGVDTNPPEEPTWLEGSKALIDGVRGGIGGWVNNHMPAEYARRLRLDIPVAIGTDDVNYPGLKALDDYFAGQDLPEPASGWLTPSPCNE